MINKEIKSTIRTREVEAKHNPENFHNTLNDYYKEAKERQYYEKENSKLITAIDMATGTINELCADGYIPQHKMEEGQQ
ncbi:MAG TPA: hypothetical protein GX747_03460 [Tenericutes bacterium]|nr:hypothetical protein [Mycoplasmatota bacterium]